MATDAVSDGERAYEFSPDTSPTEAVVTAVARADGSDPVPEGDGATLEPLYEAIDPDALDALLTEGDRGLRVSFHYAGYRVTVRGGDRTRVTLVDAPGGEVAD